MSEDPRTEAVKMALHICEIRYCIDKIVENEEVTYRVVDTSGEDLEYGYSGHPMGEYSRIPDATERRNQLTAEYILAAADAAAWRPIEEAPKDGTEVLVWAPYDGVVSSKFKHGCWQKLTVVFGRGESNNDPTHFRHLPTSPQEPKS